MEPGHATENVAEENQGSSSAEATTQPVEENPEIEAEGDDYNDGDSAFEGSDYASSTESLSSSILRYRQENGRTYHAYKDGIYVLPNDEAENDRLDLQHHLYSLTYGGKISICPIPKEKQIHRVLDVGTGTGIWAIDYADEHPESHVVGVDLSPIQPSFVPPNVSFEIDDLEQEWGFGQKFDYIHSRMMTASFANWPRFFEQSFQNLNPGGYIEVSDVCFPARADDDTYPEDSALRQWCQLLLDGTIKIGRPNNSALLYREQIKAAGFVDVVERQYYWPMNRWPRDKKMKELGMWTLENFGSGLSGISMALFTRALGWSPQQVEVFLVNVRKEMQDTRIHAYYPIFTLYARRPE